MEKTQAGSTTKEKENISLSLLKVQRSRTKASITRLVNNVEKSACPSSIELECRLEILNSYIKEIMAYQLEIEKIEDDGKRGEIEEECIKAKSMLRSKLKELNPDLNESGHNDNTIMHYQQPTNKLPPIKIPKFSGKYNEYKNFITCFKQFVHKERSLSKTEKFNYLISCLSEEALRTVKAFQITEDNYDLALKRLEERYDNKCLIFKDLISSLFEIPKMQKPSASDLRQIVDNVSATFDSLSTLGNSNDIAQCIIIHLVLSKVDIGSKEKWDEQLDYKELPSWKQCSDILIRRCQFLEMSGERHQNTYNNNNPTRNNNHKQASSFVVATNSEDSRCLFCHTGEHKFFNCELFKSQSVNQRFEFVKSKGLCINCFRKGHSAMQCKSSKCKVCTRSHNTLLHRFSESNSTTPQSQNAGATHINSQNLRQSMHTSSSGGQIILATAIIYIDDKFGNPKAARALLDSGSQVNLITEGLVQSLSLKKQQKHINILGVGEACANITQKIETTIRSRLNGFKAEAEFFVLKTISSNHPNKLVRKQDLDIPKNIKLADPNFDMPQKIDLLLGADIYFNLLSTGQIKLGPNLPILQKTLLGWIVSGKCGIQHSPVHHSLLNKAEDVELQPLNDLVTRFWELEELPVKTLLNEEQKSCAKHFEDNTVFLPNGQFEVRLPFKLDSNNLGSSFEIAKRRFLSLERRLEKNPELKLLYTEFMEEYFTLGHMSQIENVVPKTSHYFIPHQCVLRPDSTSTKLRVVFDASCKTSSKLSLNNTLMVGPTIQNDLFTTLIRFRLMKYAISADITKMYRQISVHTDDRRFQLIIWRKNPQEPLGIYQLNTVTYGTASAPYLAVRCLKEASNIFNTQFPTGAKAVETDFYVDDLLSGADTEEELYKLYQEVNTIMKSCGFTLTKWYSNSNMHGYDDEKTFEFNESECTKTLGLVWNPKKDCLGFKINALRELATTKRNILSTSSRLFDPMGLLAPIIIKAKIILQELWLNKLDWDESVPLHIETAWSRFKTDIPQISRISTQRFVGTERGARIQIHGFADASIRAYGCCIYIRSQKGGQSFARLLAAKSKVAPLKTKTLPRLELCAAHLLIKLWQAVESLISAEIESRYCWTDSEIVLHWLKLHPSSLSTFVGNRIADIQEASSKIKWRHVPSAHNPADIISRGCTIEELEASIWFEGPKFLSKDEDTWPQNKLSEKSLESLDLEIKKTAVSLKVCQNAEENVILEMMTKFSSYGKIVRIVAYMIRAYKILRYKKKYESTTLTATEVEIAFLKIIQIIQINDYKVEIEHIRASKPLPTQLQKLSPFLHEYEEDKIKLTLLRVGGRLLNAPLPFSSKFPLLLNKGSYFLQRYLQHLHLNNCHAGSRALISLLREKIWVVNAREVVRKIVRNCILCFKFKPKLLTQIMGNLPQDRFMGCRPFLVTGVDFCGPIYTTLRIRGRPPHKTYIAVFVCFSSKAVHLEAVSDLMSDSFLLSFTRFIGRRGLPNTVWCDNGTNFQGAANVLKSQKFSKDIKQYASSKGIEFKFIPPRAPHFGGLWEAAVKSAKNLLIKSTIGASLTFEELQTLLVDIEAILNSRPLCTVTEDPSDGGILTAGHLLIGTSLKEIPFINEQKQNYNFLKRYRYITTLKERFWKMWLDDYVRDQQQKSKWLHKSENIQIGSIVMIHEDNLPPYKWLLGKVSAVDKANDGTIRVAYVKTHIGNLKRPIHKLAPLPGLVNSSHSQSGS